MAGMTATVPDATGHYPREFVQRLVDQVACFNVFLASNGAGHDGPSGWAGTGAIHPFRIGLRPPTAAGGVRAINAVGDAIGQVRFRWPAIPHAFAALPDREPPTTPVEPVRSQRFAIQEMDLTLGTARDGFHVFGAGRTFPTRVAGRRTILASAVGDITCGYGRFEKCVGNLTLCGRLSAAGFSGHAIIRILDPEGRYCGTDVGKQPNGRAPESELTYLMWAAQKGKTAEEENRPSLTADGRVRGMNIPVRLRHLTTGFSTGKDGPIAAPLRIGEPLGMEIGCGRGTIPDAPPTGTPRRPFQFEGTARYTLEDGGRQPVGAITTNVVEGRRFDVRFAAAPGLTGWRFGFFGPVIYGSAALHRAQGLFYGASGSVFEPPPGDHVVTHLYAACLDDPDGRFRAQPTDIG